MTEVQQVLKQQAQEPENLHTSHWHLISSDKNI